MRGRACRKLKTALTIQDLPFDILALILQRQYSIFLRLTCKRFNSARKYCLFVKPLGKNVTPVSTIATWPLAQLCMEWGRPAIDTMHAAAKNNHIHVLLFLRYKGMEFDKWTSSYAAGGGHIDLMHYLHLNNCPWSADTCTEAAENGHIQIVEYLYANGCAGNAATFTAAASAGHLDIVACLAENGCDWDESACDQAATHGHFSVLKFLVENGCPWYAASNSTLMGLLIRSVYSKMSICCAQGLCYLFLGYYWRTYQCYRVPVVTI